MSNKNKTIALASLIAAGAGVAAVAASNSHKQHLPERYQSVLCPMSPPNPAAIFHTAYLLPLSCGNALLHQSLYHTSQPDPDSS